MGCTAIRIPPSSHPRLYGLTITVQRMADSL